MKHTEEYSWLKECHSQILLSSLKNLDGAFTKFYNKKSRFPYFKKKTNKQSFQYPQHTMLNDNNVFLPKVGWVKFFKSREVIGKIKTVTVSKTPTNKYFVSIQCEIICDEVKKAKITKKTAVGIDLGIKTFAVTSDNEVFENQKYLHKSLCRLRVEQRKLQRCKKGSKRREKQRLVVARIYEKITNQRTDYLHKVSTYLVRKYGTICMEDLSVKNMQKDNTIAKHVNDTCFHQFNRMLEYKCEWMGKNYIKIGRYEPSSKRCHHCGHIHNELTLRNRKWICPHCGATIDRDFNAALNIRDYGLGVQPSDVKMAQ